jgi:hypothetical protein
MADAAPEPSLSELREQVERQELLLRKRTLESASNWYDDYVNPAEPLFDTPDFFFPLAGENLPFNLDNRLKGELLPVYVTEYGLKILRDYSRWLAAFNPFALNALENRVSYVVGKGFGYQTVPASGPASDYPGGDRDLCKKAQRVIGRFLERTDWGELEQEVMRRADRDGEAFLRFFHTGNGQCTVRTVEPEHVRSPGDQSAHLSFGVETPEHDVQDARAFWIVEEPSVSWSPSRVPAGEVVHVRFNVDRTAKRGYPTLVPVRKNLLRADKLLQNMSTLAQVQSTFALIRKHKQYSASAVSARQQGQADLAVSDPLGGNTRYLQRYLPGTILDVPEQTDYEFPAARVPADSLVAVLQAELRAVAARLVLPEYMLTSNAENANYASTLVAEAPAVKHFERLQRQLARAFGDGRYGGPRRSGALWRVLECAVRWGDLPREVLRRVALHVEPPSPVARDKDKETSRAEALNRVGVLSKATWAKWEGLDPARERRLLRQEKREGQPRASRGAFSESEEEKPSGCQPHKSGRFQGTDIGYDPDNYNANCRLTPKEPEETDAEFIQRLADQLRQDRANLSAVAVPADLLRSLPRWQLVKLRDQLREHAGQWSDEAASQAALQQELGKDPELARELEAQVAQLRQKWEEEARGLPEGKRRKAAPWLYEQDYRYFAPTLTSGADGRPEFGFAPTPALRRLQLMQALMVGVVVGGNRDEARYHYTRLEKLQPPWTDAEALAWYQLVGKTHPEKMADVRASSGGLVSANSDLQILVPAGALRKAFGSAGGFLLRVAWGIGANAATAAAAEVVADKYGPGAGAVVPFIPTLLGVLGRRAVSSPALRRVASRYTGPKKVHFPGGQVVLGMGPKTVSFHTWEVHLEGPLQAEAKTVVEKAAKIAGIDARKIRVGYSPNAACPVYDVMKDGKLALVLNAEALGRKEEATKLLIGLHELMHHDDISRFGLEATKKLAGNPRYEIELEKQAFELLQQSYGKRLPEETLKLHSDFIKEWGKKK